MQRAAARCMRTAWTRPLGVPQLPYMDSSALEVSYISPRLLLAYAFWTCCP